MQMAFMKIYLFILVITALLNNQCRKNKIELPACVQQKIEEIKKEPKWSPPAEVNEYIYKGRHVFLFIMPVQVLLISNEVLDQGNQL